MKISRLLMCLLTLMLCSGTAEGQMMAAKKIPPALEKKVILKADAEKVWEYISQPENYKAFSGVKVFTGEERALNSKLSLETKKGKKRNQYISFLDFDQRKICFFVTQSDYAGDRNWVYAFVVTPQGKKCEVSLEIYNGLDPLDPEFKSGISEEFDDIIAGLKKKFK